ncbi:MAG: LysM peptidoglycan-binding domain-containing protein [Bacteroidales bacterium]|nr:LysM peptidoglycan-binding domain-containing protein [Bacteroidales bacterium]MCF8343519.1 LysM peptidoglycan-binding domain-containing protein [Bacteroidales bacterium]MCF8352749.1 LysM peptidoglycan-binding domain-containing protein [Bacteroidales bacterium]MCF8377652.1 LysM peptidoglycan-binding domain-containing protein [Bacteroidales bacterium]
MLKTKTALLVLMIATTSCFGQAQDSVNAKPDTIPNKNIIAQLDSLVRLKFFTDATFITDTALLNEYGFAADSIPRYPDSVYEARIAELNAKSPIEISYNSTVQAYIDLYAIKRRALTSKMLGLSQMYFPMFEEQLDRYGLPLELKYLAIVESALNPTAGSHKGAKGLWQFMYYTGKIYDLEVTSLLDERYDPIESTIAACRLMKDLYDIYGDWNLVLAAYNSGAGNVNKAIRRAGKVDNYWAIWPFLPRETRGYVPAFFAVTYVMNYPDEHNLYPVPPEYLYPEIDTVMVNQPLAFDQISEMFDFPMEKLKLLNPQYKAGIIPAGKGKSFVLRLPRELAGEYVSREEELYAFKSCKGIEREKILKEIEKAKSRKIHTVRYGESLSVIAERYHCYVSQLRQWNNLRGNTIYAGQKLVVYSPLDDNYKPDYSSSPVQNTGENKIHTVGGGESLGILANKYNCGVSDLKRWNKLKSNTIHPGQKLIVGKIASPSKEGDQFVYYVIKEGDTLWEIAREYEGVSIDDIKQLNGISNSYRLKPGQKLRIAVKG